jgi:hypothetical protein
VRKGGAPSSIVASLHVSCGAPAPPRVAHRRKQRRRTPCRCSAAAAAAQRQRCSRNARPCLRQLPQYCPGRKPPLLALKLPPRHKKSPYKTYLRWKTIMARNKGGRARTVSMVSAEGSLIPWHAMKPSHRKNAPLKSASQIDFFNMIG